MEISLQVAKAPKNDEKTRKEDILMTCAFTMVSPIYDNIYIHLS